MAEAVPHRAGMSRKEWIVVGLLVFSVLVNYVDRGNLSLAMPLLQREFAFSSLRAAELLSAFFWTYAIVQLLGIAGWLTDRYSAGWVLMGGYLLWSLAMAFLGFAPTYAALFALQLVLGMGESVAYPCYSRIFAAMPQEHRGRANAFIDAGTKIGPAAAHSWADWSWYITAGECSSWHLASARSSGLYRGISPCRAARQQRAKVPLNESRNRRAPTQSRPF